MTSKNKALRLKPTGVKLLIKPPSRSISPETRLFLYVRAGGRCEFDGCNDYLLEHHLTLNPGNFAQMAHIFAFSPEGPRGLEPGRPLTNYLNNIVNFILLCPKCHKEIDSRSKKYTIALLRKSKRDHEDRIFYLTGRKPERKTCVLQFKANVRGQTVDIPVQDVIEAVSPFYPVDTRGNVLDLTNLQIDNDNFYELAKSEIIQKVEKLYDRGMEIDRIRHVSLFALGPVSLLVFLGSRLSSKIPLEVYQRHRDTETWTWKTNGDPVLYQFSQVRQGNDDAKVALLVSLSAKVHLDSLPVPGNVSIYEITLKDKLPNPSFLRQREDVQRFKEIYLQAQSNIHAAHPRLREILLFLAVPAPIAVLCGRERLPQAHPPMVLYDYHRTKGYISKGRIE